MERLVGTEIGNFFELGPVEYGDTISLVFSISAWIVVVIFALRLLDN